MPKRKREDEDVGDSLVENEGVDPSVKIHAARLKSKTVQSVKKLHDALKLARGFERQKLGRRQKDATKQKNEKELQRLKEEVLALKALELTETAKTHLLKQYVKTKRINESPIFYAAYGKDVNVPGPKDAAEANVVARLFNSNPVKQVMPGIMSGTYDVLGLEEYSDAKASNRKPTNTEPRAKANSAAPKINGHMPEKHEHVSESEEEFQGFSADEEQPTEEAEGRREKYEDEELNEEDFDQFNDRLASSESDADDDAYIPDLKVLSQTDGTTSIEPYSVARDLSLSPSPSPTFSESPSPPPITKAKSKTPKVTQNLKPASTTFLPSLTMGGYFSGSESEPENDANDPLLANSRKNRRGQRARQLIAERKYGKNAKHVVKAREEGGWDPKRGAVEVGEDGKKKPWERNIRKGAGDKKSGKSTGRFGNDILHERPGKGGPPRGRGPQTSGANDEGLGRVRSFGAVTAKAAEEKALHPSWEAAKRRKEDKAIGQFQGKKITFD